MFKELNASGDIPFRIILETETGECVPLGSFNWDKPNSINIVISVPRGISPEWLKPHVPDQHIRLTTSDNYCFKQTFTGLLDLTNTLHGIVEHVKDNLYNTSVEDGGLVYGELASVLLSNLVDENTHIHGSILIDVAKNTIFDGAFKGGVLSMVVKIPIEFTTHVNGVNLTNTPMSINTTEKHLVLEYMIDEGDILDIVKCIESIGEDTYRVISNSALAKQGINVPNTTSKKEVAKLEHLMQGVIDNTVLKRSTRNSFNVHGVAFLIKFDSDSNIEDYVIRFGVDIEKYDGTKGLIKPTDELKSSRGLEVYFEIDFKAPPEDIEAHVKVIIASVLMCTN